MIKKFLPVFVSVFILYFLWYCMKPSLNYQAIKRTINEFHSQDAFTRKKIPDDDFIIDELYALGEEKGIYPEEMEIIIDRQEDHIIKKITIHYKDYIRLFGFEVITRNYTYESRLSDRRQSL